MNDNQKFTRPLFFEIFNYFIENNYDITLVQTFYNHYSSKNWKNNKNEPITNWKKEADIWVKKNRIH